MFAANRSGMGAIGGRGARADGVTHMWLDIGIVALLIVGIYCFAVLTGFERRSLTRRTNRRAEDMYDQYADSPRKQRRYAREHGTWQEERHGSPPASPR
jgi:hypothetical protein